jgi:DNA-dependent RNA polymerase auxiliary subunit epsilon
MIEHFGMVLIGFIIGLYITCVVDWSVENSNKKLHESKDRLIKKQQEYIETLEDALMDYKKAGEHHEG